MRKRITASIRIQHVLVAHVLVVKGGGTGESVVIVTRASCSRLTAMGKYVGRILLVEHKITINKGRRG